MSCNSCNRNMAPNCSSPASGRNQMQRKGQYTRNQQMHRNVNTCPCNDIAPKPEPDTCGCMPDGCNPGTAPVDAMMVAMAYVPWQKWGEIYDYEKALACGTIFSDLNKPWTGRSCD